jgi:hypothetical protein
VRDKTIGKDRHPAYGLSEGFGRFRDIVRIEHALLNPVPVSKVRCNILAPRASYGVKLLTLFINSTSVIEGVGETAPFLIRIVKAI